ncbi:AsnC family transcriptional regulator [Nocardia grenadensis]
MPVGSPSWTRRLFRALSTNGRTAYADLARHVDWPESAVRYRAHRAAPGSHFRAVRWPARIRLKELCCKLLRRRPGGFPFVEARLRTGTVLGERRGRSLSGIVGRGPAWSTSRTGSESCCRS